MHTFPRRVLLAAIGVALLALVGVGLPVLTANAAPGGGGGKPAAHAFQLTSAVVTAAVTTPGAPCPTAGKSAPAGAMRTIVICGRNKATVGLTPTASLSSLSGTFIDTAGTFSSAQVPAGAEGVVLAQWTDTEIVNVPGTGYRISATIAAAGRTPGERAFNGYSATGQSAPVATNVSDGLSEDSSHLVTLSGSDADGDVLSFAIVTGPEHGSLGSVASPGCVGGACSAAVIYTPEADFNGSDSFTYRVNDGTADSAPATVTLTVSGVNDAPSFSRGGDATGVVDGPGVTIDNWATAISVGPANESGQTPQFSAVAEDPTLFDVVPAVSPSGTLTFTPGSSQGSTVVSVVLQDNGGTANGGIDTSAPQSFTISISPGNAQPTVEPTAASGLEDDGAVTVTLTGHDADGDALTFSAGTASHGLVTVPGSVSCDGLTPRTCTTTVTYTPNPDFHGADSFTYTANDGTVESSTATAAITINGVNDSPTFTKGADANVLEDSGAQVISSWATDISAGPAESGQNVDFIATTDNDALFAALPAISASGDLSFAPAADLFGSATVTVTLADDGGTANGGDDTGPQVTFTISVAPVNDVPSFIKGADESVAEDAGAQSVSGWASAISKGPANESDQSLSFSTSNDNNALFSSQPAVSPTGTLTYTPTADATGSTTVTVSVSDDGGTANGGDDTGDAQTFTITVGWVNDEPSFTHDGDQTLLEDAGAQEVTGFVNSTDPGPGEFAQTVHVAVTEVDNPALFSVPPSIDAAGTLSFSPAVNANGTAAVTARAFDDGGTANGGDDTGPQVTFLITVTPVNDVPSFTKGADQVVLEDAGAQSVSNWAAAISKGPADESGQGLSFSASNDNNALFSSQPAVSPTGTLTFTSATNKHGTATVTVFLSDDGGTANGGDDTSDAQTFTITVNPVNDAPVAAAKSFTVQSGMKISLGGLLTGASDAADVAEDPSYTPAFTVGSITPGAGCVGCTISNIDQANGTFDFDPPAGGTGTYTISYTVRDNGSPGPGADSVPQTITFTVIGPAIWFVDADAAFNGTGRLSAPFNNLASATAAMGSAANQRIFVEDGNVAGNVTLPTDGWLVSDGATGASFDAVMGITPPAGTIARPTVNQSQRMLTGTVTLGTNSVARGFDLTPTATNKGLVASGRTGVTVDQMSITTTAARAVDLANSSGTFNLTRVSASGADRGISVVSTNTSSGSFTVTGSGSAGTGGLITGSTIYGVYLQDTSDVSLRWMTISGSGGSGVRGANVNNLLLRNSTLPNNGTGSSEGMYLSNLLGSSSIQDVDVSGSARHGAVITNSSGTASISVANSIFRDSAGTDGFGLIIQSAGSAAVSFTSTGNTFSNNTGPGLGVVSGGTQRLNATITGGSYNLNYGGLSLIPAGSGGLDFTVTGGTITGCALCGLPISIEMQSSTANSVTGTISGMTINTQGFSAIRLLGQAPGFARVAVTNNQITHAGGFGILASIPGGFTGDLIVTGNTINMSATTNSAIYASADTSGSLCAHIANNTISHPGGTDIQLVNALTSTAFRLPGYGGAATDTTAVRNFLLAQNTAADATATVSAGGGFSGGGACTAP